ncbi:S8 family serine peptidase [Fibrella sp. HMF5335]|uniref:S8 family serine peptidase n=1 Tax=Fibrella rubiginis TaxID=2817060 RepID=A0A939GJQ3_9BACT|nr:S8 family peptidase [Fibrella rubiginis]MBO0937712.1 S8 family serine peptidase [Fibrella rubiginis]
MKQSFHTGRRMLAALLCGGFLYSCQPQIDVTPTQQPGQGRVGTDVGYVPGEVLIKFKSGTANDKVLKALAKMKVSKSEKILTKMMEKAGDTDGVILASVPTDVLEAVSQLKGMPEIEYAEPNYIYTTDVTANDTYFSNGSLWGMYGPGTSPANQYGSQAATAWAANKTGSSSVIVGIIDEGWMITHSELAANKWVNPYETVNGKDDDGNGYIDDVNGWDFANNNASVYDDVNDDHGTHVAGTIGAVGGNGAGVAGVCWNVKMIGLKFLGASGGTSANAIKAIDYLTDMKTRHPSLGIVASNNSWGGGGFSQTLQDAIGRANTANILFVAAAGNGGSDGVGDNNDAVANYPSNYPNANIIAVAALTSAGARASFSNYGATTVDIGAPGQGIWSTVPGTGNTFSYASYNGTSMATPHVTGAVALYKSLNPTATAAQIKAAILAAAVPTAALSGKCVTGGRLSVATF